MSNRETAVRLSDIGLAESPNERGMTFDEAVEGLLRGDFSRLEPLYCGNPCPIVIWHSERRFTSHPEALEEALTCACFNGRTETADYLLNQGVALPGGPRTGLNAFHWAANRGQLETVRMLLRRGAPLEDQNIYGGTVLGCAVWSAIYEPKQDHLTIIKELLDSGADVNASGCPTGNARIDTLLRNDTESASTQ